MNYYVQYINKPAYTVLYSEYRGYFGKLVKICSGSSYMGRSSRTSYITWNKIPEEAYNQSEKHVRKFGIDC